MLIGISGIMQTHDAGRATLSHDTAAHNVACAG